MYDRDGRNPYGSRGGYVVHSRPRGRGRRGDRGMDYDDMRRDMRMMDNDMPRGGRHGRARYHNEPDYEMMHNNDMPYEDDGHHLPETRQGGYEPVEFMGYCSGYYGSPDRGDYRGRDYGDMRGNYRYDYRGGYGRRDYGDYGYDDYGDYGETLSEKELEHWNKKLLEQLDEREKQMFHKDIVVQKAKALGKPMEGFGEKELYTATLMVYTDYKMSIGQNVDLAIKLAYDWLSDKDVAVKGAEKLAVYYDCIVEGE